MFTYTGLTVKQCDMMTDKYHIYMTKNGRIAMTGLTTSNVDHVAKAITDVTNNA